MTGRKRPKLAVYKFASCDGCQLSVLDCEDELLAIADKIDICNFPEASSRFARGPYDISLVEGSVTTPHDLERIKKVRAESKFLVTIGACATAGGIQALRNFTNVQDYNRTVYAKPEYISTLDHSHPIAEVVPVDYELQGCPVSKTQLLELIGALLAGRKPAIPNESVCMECKRKGNVCIAVAAGAACMGTVTRAGCGALCPSYGRPCYGCFGPKEMTNTKSQTDWWLLQGHDRNDVIRMYKGINAWSPVFRKEISRHDQQDD